MSDSTTPVRLCTTCGRSLPATADYYTSHPSGLYGLSNKCRDCKRAYDAEHAAENKEAKRLRNRSYYLAHRDEILSQQPAYRAGRADEMRDYFAARYVAKRDVIVAQQRLLAEKHPERRHANYLLNYSRKKGLVVARPCDVCGAPKVEGHHDDYAKPLDVRWLCRSHHRKLHHQLSH